MYHNENAPAMGAPVEMEVAKAAGHPPPVSGLPRDWEWPMRQAEVVMAEDVVAVATAQVALASTPKVGGE